MRGGATLITAIRGPVMLILVGLLFTADQLGSYRFRDTWPLLIIAFGILKLLEQVRASRPVRGETPGGRLP